MSTICDHTNGDISTWYIRTASIAIFSLVACFAIAIPAQLGRRIARLLPVFKPLVNLVDAEARYTSSTKLHEPPLSRPRGLFLSIPAIAEATAWTVLATSSAVHAKPHWTLLGSHTMLLELLLAVSWTYAAIRPFRPQKSTPHYDLLVFYLIQISLWVIAVGAVAYRGLVCGGTSVSLIALAASLAHTVGIITPLATLFVTPTGIPTYDTVAEGIGKDISPEDYSTLWKWSVFSWLNPLVKLDINADKDVWELAPMMSIRSIYSSFRDTEAQYSTLTRRIWAGIGPDILVQIILCFISVVLEYSSPFFLKLILDAITTITSPSPSISALERRQAKANAFVYAIVSLFCSLARSITDLQHLWISRRASTRLRSWLMATIYEKALKRREVASMARKSNNSGDGDKKQSVADLGKIVNLMSGDTYRLEDTVAVAYVYYSAPIQLMFAIVFLYKLLGWSAFSGVVVFAVVIPANHFLAAFLEKLSIRMSAARDARMSIINELVSEVKFVKFFASEDRWIKRALDARMKELKLFIASTIVFLGLEAFWTCSPVLVSISAFSIFVLTGGKLTVSVAFPAIQLFAMLGGPLGIIPGVIMKITKARVALNRIASFLGEQDVPDFVTSLVDSKSKPDPPADKLGIRNGNFHWNEIENTPARKDTSAGERWWKRWRKKRQEEIANITTGTMTPRTPRSRFELRNIDIIFPDGHLTVITGPTASGKTALLHALLGEMTIATPRDIPTFIAPESRVFLPKDHTRLDARTGLRPFVTYAAQTPWLEHLTIRDNILFGSEYEKERYEQVLECCALVPDMEILEDGDQTEIGARGVTLSGGQKARVALARAVYARSKYVLLDDPLSAVDSHTSRWLFERLFRGPLLENRTVVLVTHHLDLVLPGTHYIIKLAEGRIAYQGLTKEPLASNQLQVVLPEVKLAGGPAEEEKVVENKEATEKKAPRKLVEEEKRAIGRVQWRIYKTYIKASTYLPWILFLATIVSGAALTVGEKVWIQIWGEAYSHSPSATVWPKMRSSSSESKFALSRVGVSTIPLEQRLPSVDDHPLFYIGVFSAFALGAAFLGVLSNACSSLATYKASKNLFARILHGVVHATMRWHDTTPAGRILNRFSKDIQALDDSIAYTMTVCISSIFAFIMAATTIIVIAPTFIFPAIFITIAYVKLSIIYLRTMRSLKRLESTSRSPIYAIFRETLEGITTIRAFSAEKRFLDSMMSRIDNTTKFYWAYWMLNRWLLSRFDWLGAASVFTVIMITLFNMNIPIIGDGHREGAFASSPADGSRTGFAGLLITSAMGFTMSVYWACRCIAGLELQLNSVERIVEYLEVPQEGATSIESRRPPAYWPSSSNTTAFLSVEDLVVKYAPELPAVLHGVSFEVKAREKIGLLGRTGSGKSTLAMSLLRFAEPAGGRIVLDGIDISTIGLNDLRSRITFIPQDSVLFTGTIRDNLDIFNEYSDEACMEALRRAHVIDVSEQPRLAPEPAGDVDGNAEVEEHGPAITLEAEVAARGTNLSHGQRQLIALARAVLRRTAIVIMDEATSSIDFAMDTKIQATLREEFKDACVITVAHRLQTVIDYDRLILLDNGRIAEEGSPWELLQLPEGLFRSICMNSGMMAELEAAAKRAVTK